SVRLSSRRARASHRSKSFVRLLAGGFCAAAQSRSLDRVARNRESSRGNDLRGKKRQAAGAETILCRSCYTRHASAQSVHLPARIACGQRDEQSRDQGTTDCFLRWNRERRVAGEVLFHARKRWKI